MKGKTVFKVILLVVLLLLLAVLSVVAYITAKLDLIQFADEVDNSAYQETLVLEQTDEEEEEGLAIDIEGLEQVETLPVIPEGEIWEEEDVLNILVLGTDERTKELNVNARSDAMILVSINKKDNTVKLVSLERGMGVPILDGQYEGNYDILTHIFRYGGADLVTRTVREVLKVDVDYYVRFNFYAVKQIVDMVGGIDMELTAAEASRLNGSDISKNATTDDQKTLVEGMNHLDGGVTLAFARLRSIDSDWRRIERQRKVIIAMVDALKDSTLTELNDLVTEALPMVQTNLTKLEIAELMLYAPKFLSASFDQMTIPKQGTYGGATGLHGQGMFAPDYELNSQILHDFLYGTEGED
ncbi:MAG: LCP family protein [Oscillospiraceae bacterium]|nr:LCP family protein [Oscillospiraceae bacterium]